METFMCVEGCAKAQALILAVDVAMTRDDLTPDDLTPEEREQGAAVTRHTDRRRRRGVTVWLGTMQAISGPTISTYGTMAPNVG